MIKDLLIEFDKNNEEKKITKLYIMCGLPIMSILLIFFPPEISFTIFSIIIIVLLYLYMYFKIENKISKSIFHFIKNIKSYNKYSYESNQTHTIDFLKNNNIYNKESILFIIDNLKPRKKTKIKRDWISILISLFITLISISINEGVIDIEQLINIITQITPYFLSTIIIFITIESLKWIFRSTFQIEISIDSLEEILIDEYLKLTN